MNNILHKANPLIKVWSSDEQLRLADIDAYKIKIEHDCAQMILEAKNQVELIKQEAHDNGVENAQVEINELASRIDKQVSGFFQELDSELTKIIYRVLDKFGFSEINTKHLAQVIQTELHNLQQQQIEINANKQTVEELSVCLADNSQTIHFNVDNRIPKNKIYLRSQFYEQILNLDEAQQKLHNYLLNEVCNYAL